MTQKIFYEDAYCREFDAAVVSCTEHKDRYEIILDRTAFYPEGGGQSGDTGTLSFLTDEGEIMKEYSTIAAAVAESGVSSKSIRDAANGIQKHAGGYCWKYKD